MNPGPTSTSSVRADANRRRILDVALIELLRDPDASMDQIARAAGVVRRTVYGHFPSRDALVGAILDDAVEAVETAHVAGRAGVADPAEALARSMLAVWQVTDRYRLLLSLARRSVTMEGIRDRLAPVRTSGTELIQQGLESGQFTSPLPANALAYVVEQVLFGLMEAVNDGALETEQADRSAVISILIAAGLPAPDATALMAKILD